MSICSSDWRMSRTWTPPGRRWRIRRTPTRSHGRRSIRISPDSARPYEWDVSTSSGSCRRRSGSSGDFQGRSKPGSDVRSEPCRRALVRVDQDFSAGQVRTGSGASGSATTVSSTRSTMATSSCWSSASPTAAMSTADWRDRSPRADRQGQNPRLVAAMSAYASRTTDSTCALRRVLPPRGTGASSRRWSASMCQRADRVPRRSGHLAAARSAGWCRRPRSRRGPSLSGAVPLPAPGSGHPL